MDTQHLTDGELSYWHDYHTTRLGKDRDRLARLSHEALDGLRSESYTADLIESCEVSIRHSERILLALRAEMSRRQGEVAGG